MGLTELLGSMMLSFKKAEVIICEFMSWKLMEPLRSHPSGFVRLLLKFGATFQLRRELNNWQPGGDILETTFTAVCPFLRYFFGRRHRIGCTNLTDAGAGEVGNYIPEPSLRLRHLL